MRRIFFTFLLTALFAVATFAQTYKANLSQTTTAAPTATEFVNTFSVDPVFTRVGTGLYRLYIADAFPDEERIFGLNQQVLASSSGTTLSFVRVSWDDESEPSGSSLIIYTFDRNMQNGTEQAADSLLNRTPFEITVYPAFKKKPVN